KGEKNNLIINKCWNIIRQVVEFDSFIPEFYNNIEGTLKPLFEYILNPDSIEFEDDIVLVMKTFIKKTKKVSPTLWTIFPHLIKVFEKNKRSFGNLLDALNQFLLHGREELINDKSKLVMLVHMGTLSMFSTESNVTVQNSEGCIFLQLLFQIFRETSALNDYFEEILNKVLERMRVQPMQDHLKRHLILVFMNAIAYNSVATFNYLDKNGVTQEMINQMLDLSQTFTNTYERKAYVIGLSCLLAAATLPPLIVEHLKRVIENAIIVLSKQKMTETKSLKKAGQKELKDQDGDSDGDDEGADSEYEPSDDDEGKDDIEPDEDIKSEEEKKGGEADGEDDDEDEADGGNHGKKGKDSDDESETDEDESIDELVTIYLYLLTTLH
ncbi:MAG: hypothetical protein ACMG6E_10105, partial [Candidatus Roizmanbacteria bacterium]